MIYKTIDNGYELQEEFGRYGRGDAFSALGYDALFEYLEECGDVELNVVGLCCDFSEYDSEEIAREYGHMAGDEYEDEEEKTEAILDCLRDETLVLDVDCDRWIIQSF